MPDLEDDIEDNKAPLWERAVIALSKAPYQGINDPTKPYTSMAVSLVAAAVTVGQIEEPNYSGAYMSGMISLAAACNMIRFALDKTSTPTLDQITTPVVAAVTASSAVMGTSAFVAEGNIPMGIILTGASLVGAWNLKERLLNKPEASSQNDNDLNGPSGPQLK